MDMHLDLFGGAGKARLPTDLSGDSAPVAVLAPLDWPGLAARLAAAHAARQILTGRPGLRVSASGSFAPDLARDVVAWRATASRQQAPSSHDINRNTKADGKPLWTIGQHSAGVDRSDVRGLL
jgi:hypothetical protein